MAEQRRSWIGLQHWYRKPLGRLFGAAETRLLAEILPRLFGYHLVALGVPTATDLLATSPIAHRCRLDAISPPAGSSVDLLADPACLPLASDSIDVVVAPHVLEFVAEPHAVLREIDRVLIPEGHAVILGFNPFSLWGVRRLLHARSRTAPWDARLLSARRVRDWLTLLGFDTLAVRYYCYRLPWTRTLHRLTLLERLGPKYWPAGGGGYVLLARKRVSTLTPIKPSWRPVQNELAAGALNKTVAELEHLDSKESPC